MFCNSEPWLASKVAQNALARQLQISLASPGRQPTANDEQVK